MIGFGGTDRGARISGGVQLDYGLASGATIFAGSQVVENGGIARASIVHSGGTEYVSAGGSINGVTIRGGIVDLASGALVGSKDLTFSGGGELVLNDAIDFGGLVAGFGASDSIDLVDIKFVATGKHKTKLTWTQLTSGTSASGTLAVSQGGHTADITLLGQYVAGNFSLQSGGFGGTLVTDPPVLATVTSSPVLVNPHHI